MESLCLRCCWWYIDIELLHVNYKHQSLGVYYSDNAGSRCTIQWIKYGMANYCGRWWCQVITKRSCPNGNTRGGTGCLCERHAHTHERTFAHMHACTHAHTHASTQAHKHASRSMHTHTQALMHTHTRACTHTRSHTRMQTHTHTHTTRMTEEDMTVSLFNSVTHSPGCVHLYNWNIPHRKRPWLAIHL